MAPGLAAAARRPIAILAVLAGCLAVLPALARASSFTYAGTGVPVTIAEGQTATSTTAVPEGLPPVVDIDVVSLGLTAAPDASDQTVSLTAPGGTQRLIVNSGCAGYPGGSSFTLDQQAQTNPFGGPGTCPPGTGTYRPSNSPASSTPLTDLLGPGAGSWTLAYADAGAAGSGGTLGSWALRITHAPIKLTAKRKQPQRTGKLVRITARCNGECTLRVGGDAKKRALGIESGVTRQLALPVRASALRRTRDGGRLRIRLHATGRYLDVDERELSVTVVPPPSPPPPVCAARAPGASAAC